MLEKIQQLTEEAVAAIEQAASSTDLDLLKAKYLGKKSEILAALKSLKDLSPEEKPKVGQLVNQAKIKITNSLSERRAVLQKASQKATISKEKIDVTLPARGPRLGKHHPITLVLEEVKKIFKEMGYVVAEGPDIESEYNNFEALNIPSFHPSRDMHDTFYLKSGDLLRTHTSPVQIRYMKKNKPPFAIIAPGRVYRRDADVTHSAVFHQVEGLLVDKKVTFADLKGTLSYFLHQFFGKNRRVRFRPSYFPFTEPSAEVDVECIMCSGKGCRVCKESGWLEILGAGMVDPNVFKAVGYDPEKYLGFAFGVGIERLAMLKYGIDDIRLFFENRINFLEQF
ncbi:MAG: phenylalanine--tRNA ligase subunit alpha [Candidatus Margulisbacteria bacterium]|nr:phenylalanine--tRNA ligase subunit alpha [Candidatus Margulisiibacteriota bacterium]MBU1021114.1 phenylalanine--tRNA ligase subunit alpha [Candidatus Margulisiibacteriota bacterium]MBU1728669.1 phenylalanine--tRNA ligase subunit alpha [Candidatus Margulisiibacteriota bacterium]MBU1955120.1 phenylalanine--tRNA ligase subunit alpha [Candidatus Margulisiibacteriota bacterium]